MYPHQRSLLNEPLHRHHHQSFHLQQNYEIHQHHRHRQKNRHHLRQQESNIQWQQIVLQSYRCEHTY
jgi:hypothetical protein